MKFGVFLPTFLFPGTGPEHAAQVRAFARRAEELGFDSLWITDHINEIEQRLTSWTGKAVFPRDVYYFKEIPTNVDPGSVALVNLGAVVIAVVFSLLPAYRAARLHPVRALRFE